MKTIIAALAFAMLSLSTNANIDKLEIDPNYHPYDVVLFETIETFCREHRTEFNKWEQAYLKRVIAEKGLIYPTSGSIFSPSNRDQERANKVAFYSAVRLKYGDTLHTLTDRFIIYKKGKPKAPSVKP